MRRLRIQELVEHFRNDPAPLDLLPEVHLLRALVTDYVERYSDFVDAMHAWHATYTKEYREAFSSWREQIIRLTEDEGWRDTEPEDIPTAPDPLDFVDKPRQVLDISAAASLVDKVGAMVDRIERHKREGAISLETLDRVLEQLGMEVVNSLRAEADDATRTRVLADLERRWANVHIDTSSRLKPRNSTDLN